MTSKNTPKTPNLAIFMTFSDPRGSRIHHFWTIFGPKMGQILTPFLIKMYPKSALNRSRTGPKPTPKSIKKWSKSWVGGSKLTSKNPKFSDFGDKKHTFLDPEKPVFWPILGSWDILWNGVMPNPGPKNRYLVGASSNFPYGPFCAVFGYPILGGPKNDKNVKTQNSRLPRSSSTFKKSQKITKKRWSGGHKNRFLEVKIDPQNPFFDPFFDHPKSWFSRNPRPA